MYAFLLSTAVIFVAELGDKSQLMAMTFAARYRARDALIGITAATALVHLASVGIGYFIGDTFAGNQHWISVVAGVAFLGFACMDAARRRTRRRGGRQGPHQPGCGGFSPWASPG